jgi:hypothetical protein
MKSDAYGFLLREIVREVVREELKIPGKTPADYRLDSSYPKAEDLAEIVSREIPLSVEQLRKYERGDIIYVDSPNTARRIAAIAERLKAPVQEYRNAIRRKMNERQSAKERKRS